MPETYSFTLDDIIKILPHRPPFLFVDSVKKMVPDKYIVSTMVINESAPWFKGHFPQKAIMPGVLVTDALAQTSGLLWGFTKQINGRESEKQDPEIFYLAAANMKYVNPSYPGDTLVMTSRRKNNFGQFHMYDVDAVAGRKVIAKGELTLAMVEGNL